MAEPPPDGVLVGVAHLGPPAERDTYYVTFEE